MYEESIKKQASCRAELKLVNRRETAGSSGQAILVCWVFFIKSHLYCAVASVQFSASV